VNVDEIQEKIKDILPTVVLRKMLQTGRRYVTYRHNSVWLQG
jgi:hypothetical protein